MTTIGSIRTVTNTDAASLFAGPGEMRALCRAHDWSATPLGRVESWPTSLRTTAQIVLAAPTAMLLLWGPELVQIYNDAYSAVIGSKHPTALGQPTHTSWPEARDFREPAFKAVLERGESFTFENRRLVIERDGVADDAFFLLAYSPVPDDAGGVGGALVTVFETTEQVLGRRAEAERARLTAVLERERMALFEEVFRTAPSFLHVLRGSDFIVEFANDAYYDLVGRRDLIGRPAFEAMPEIASDHRERIAQVMATQEPFIGHELSVTLARAPGEPAEERIIDLVYLPLIDDRRECTGVLGHGTDVTESVRARREIEQALRVSEIRYRSLFESIDEGFCVIEVLFDENGRPVDYVFLEANPAFVKQTGLVNAIGQRMRDLAPSHEQHWFDIYGKVAVTGDSTRFEAPADALGHWFDVYAFRFGEPRDCQVAVVFNNIVDRKRAELERERLLAAAEAERAQADHARREAEAANRAKSEFLAVMSHELRTPLNAIGGYAELMELGIRGPVTPEQRADLARIKQSERHLLGLINQVLNYTRIDAGAVRYDVVDVTVGDALAAAAALIVPQARARELTYVLGDCECGVVVHADREKLQQILLNLLSNAVKFTEPGGEIRIACTQGSELIAISVSDTGIGIASDKLAHIFEPFVQIDQRLTRAHEGVGLGLAISRDLARGMGGDLIATSMPGAGSTFTVTLPRSPRT